MNILMVIDDFFPDVMRGNTRGVRELGLSLAKRNHSVFVLTTNRANEKLPLMETVGGLNIYRLRVNAKNDFLFFASVLKNAAYTLNQILKNTSLDVINFHQPFSAFCVSMSRRIKDVPKVYTFHSPWHLEYEIKTHSHGIGSFVRRLIEKMMLSRCERIVVLSNYTKELISGIHNLAAGSLRIVPGGIDSEKFKPVADKKVARSQIHIEPQKKILFTVRNLTWRMGLENLIEATKIIVKARQDILLIIGGTGALEQKLKGIVNDLGLTAYVKFIGQIEEESLPLYYQTADLFILPTKYLEGFGLVTLEALSSGLPVLGTPVGSTKEILSRLDEDLLFKDTDAASMAEKILEHLSSKDLVSLGKKCRDFVVSNYSWDKVAQEYEKVYQEVLVKKSNQ